MQVPSFVLGPGARAATEVALVKVLHAAMALELPASAEERAAVERIQGKLVHEFVTWKWTEAGGGAGSGKYQGCPFWSVEAVRLWDEHRDRSPSDRYKLLAHDHVMPLVWRLEAENVTDARVRALGQGGADLKAVMPHVRCAVLDADVFAALAALPLARSRLAELLVAKLHDAGGREEKLRALHGSMVLADAGRLLTSVAEREAAPEDREGRGGSGGPELSIRLG